MAIKKRGNFVMTKLTNYYKLLGVKEGASANEIIAGYLQAKRNARTITDEALKADAMKAIEIAFKELNGLSDTAIAVPGASNNQSLVPTESSGVLASIESVSIENIIDYYSILHVEHDATAGAIAEAYKKLLELYQQGYLSQSIGEEQARQTIDKAQEGLMILSNLSVRQKYDALLAKKEEAKRNSATSSGYWTTEPIRVENTHTNYNRSSVPMQYPGFIIGYINAEILRSGNFAKPTEDPSCTYAVDKLYGMFTEDFSFKFVKECENASFLRTVFGQQRVTSKHNFYRAPWTESIHLTDRGTNYLIYPATRLIPSSLLPYGIFKDRIGRQDLLRLEEYIQRMIIETPEVLIQAFEAERAKSHTM